VERRELNQSLPNKCRDCSQCGRPGPNLSGIRHSGSDLPWACWNVAGRGSSIEAFPLFGFDLDDYDSLFSEKLELLLKIRENTHVHWTGRHRAPLTRQAVYPRPLQNPLPIWVGVGGTPESFVRAGTLGLPLMVAIIGGEPKRFRPLIDLYREAGAAPDTPPRNLSLDFTQSASWETPRRRLQTISIRDTLTHSQRSGRSAAGPRNSGAIWRSARTHRGTDYRRCWKGGGEDTLRERSSRRSFSNHLSDGRLGPSTPEDVTVDQATGNRRCSECPETADDCLVAWRILGRWQAPPGPMTNPLLATRFLPSALSSKYM